MRKSSAILEAMKENLGLTGEQKTTDDLLFTLETVSCLGACGLSPVISVNDQIYTEMTPVKAIACLDEIRGEVAESHEKKREKVHL